MKKYDDEKEIKKIRKFFGFDSQRAHFLKSIKVPAVTKLEWLEEIRRSICRLPPKIGKKLVEELKQGKYLNNRSF